MAHGFLCTCKRCNPSIFDSIFGTTKKSPFANSGKSGSKTANSKKYGPNQSYYGGKGRPDGPGHGHRNPNNGFDRKPVSDFLGNSAIRGSGGGMGNRRSTPKT